jgi:hypothetical protein
MPIPRALGRSDACVAHAQCRQNNARMMDKCVDWLAQQSSNQTLSACQQQV